MYHNLVKVIRKYTLYVYFNNVILKPTHCTEANSYLKDYICYYTLHKPNSTFVTEEINALRGKPTKALNWLSADI